MRKCRRGAGLVLLLASLNFAQQPSNHSKAAQRSPSGQPSAPSDLQHVLESKVKAEWEALKARNKKAYGDLLADDYVAVEDDGNGERNKIQEIAELDHSNIFNYSISVFNSFSLAPDAAFVRYEITMEFPPKAAFRYKRVYVTEIWLKREGQWKARHYQETRVR
ncbi:MAG: hypothetical protein DMG69_17575 [Acidobacteria bacterium]|nr:MAG: hypothetical protein DMG69_17575 [Acidobacteriota bacterium]